MATPRKQDSDNQNQDASTPNQQQQNHAQTPDQGAANRGAFAQSSYQSTQKAGAHASGPTAKGSQGADGNAGDSSNVLNAAVQAGKKWLDDSGITANASQLPQAAKEWGSKALTSVNALSTTQKVVGGALLLAGAAYLSTRGGKSKKKKSDSYSAYSDDMDYRSGSKPSSGARQNAWAGYSGDKSATSRYAGSGSRADGPSYGTERRATSGSGSSYGRSSTNADFGSSRNGGGRNSGGNVSSRPADADNGNRSRYDSGSSYSNSRSSGPSASGGSRGSRYGNTPNSNEQDYDVTF